MSDWRESQVRRRLDVARKQGSTTLDLSYLKIDEIPTEVFALRNLQALYLRGNLFRSMGSSFERLSHIAILDLRGNPLKKVIDRPGLLLDGSVYRLVRKALAPEHVHGLQTMPGDVPWFEIYGLPNLTTLDLSPHEATSNRCGAFDWPDFDRLQNLRELEVWYTGVTDLPESISSLQALQKLELGGSFFDVLPDRISNLASLDYLGASDIGLSSLPDWISDLGNLKYLNLAFNKLHELPETIGELIRLETLFVEGNSLSGVPRTVAGLNALEVLILSGNPLIEFPEPVLSVARLQSLYLEGPVYGGRSYFRGNAHVRNYNIAKVSFHELPSKILQLRNLEILRLDDQPITTPPPEVWKEGIAAVRDYFRQRQDSGTDYLCEAKLLIVGEPGAGKTSLAKKLIDADYELPVGDTGETTRGIDVLRWSFSASIKRQEEEAGRLLERDFQVNIWDFGGQQIYHATHQFFLTHRSLYVLLADSRKEDTDYQYWLNVVELLAGESPLIIVKNEKQDVRREMNDGALRGRFPNLKETLATNLQTNRGLDEVVQQVQRWLTSLPHIGTPLPATWKAVRDALDEDTRDYIDLDEYLTICQKNGFTKHNDKLQLSGYLHDLGICLHFRDDTILQDTVILNPRWGTDAVYRVLDHPTVINSHGRFTREELADIWTEDRYDGMHDALLQLMIRFGLCYRLEAGAYLAPQRLGANQPDYAWGASGNLHLRYAYDFMPKGIVTQFIVAMHGYIEDQATLWRDGVIVERDGTRAEIIEVYGRHEVSVRVSGPDARSLLSIVDHELERVHARFRKLKYHRLIPCTCDECGGAAEPYFYEMEDVRRFAKKEQGIQCRRSAKLVDAATLIGNVFETRNFITDAIDAEDGIDSRRHGVPGVREAADPEEPAGVFVSYAWGDESEAIVDQVAAAFEAGDVTLIRDKSEMAYKDSIREFMKRIGKGSAVVVVVSKKYLQSQSCMFELTQIAGNRGFFDRVFPIVLEDAGIFEPVERVKYLKYWEDRQAELNEAVKDIDLAKTKSIQADIDLYDEIRSTMDGLMDILKDMNTFTPEQHRGDGFARIIEAIKDRLRS